MARKSSINYFQSRGGFFTTIKGRQILLASGVDDSPGGPVFAAALAAFRKLLEVDNAPQAKDENKLGTVIALYLERVKSKPVTVQFRKAYLDVFAAELGEKPVGSLTHFEVETVTERMRKPRPGKNRKVPVQWTDGSVRNALQSLLACLNWAVKKGLLANNPLKGIECPKPRSRGAECVVSREQHQTLLAKASKSVRPVLICLEATGARLSEIINATAAHYDPILGAIVYKPREKVSHKSSRFDKLRVVLLTGEAHLIVQGLVKQYPHGKLFRSLKPARGNNGGEKNGWTMMQFQKSVIKLRDAVWIPNFSSVSYRHTFATRWLSNSGSIEILAALLGNTPEIIRKHYSHLVDDRHNLRRWLEEFRQGQGS